MFSGWPDLFVEKNRPVKSLYIFLLKIENFYGWKKVRCPEM
jgi:hypothetical protein